MACQAYKLKINGCVLPEMYFSWDAARAAQDSLKESTIASAVSIITVWTETGQPY